MRSQLGVLIDGSAEKLSFDALQNRLNEATVHQDQ